MCMYKENATKPCMEHRTNKGFAGKNLRLWKIVRPKSIEFD